MRLSRPRHAKSNYSFETRPRTRVSPEPDSPPPVGIPGDATDFLARDTQAVCGFRCLASKHTPFFQTSNVVAAILRARVRRAISGLIPLATSAS